MAKLADPPESQMLTRRRAAALLTAGLAGGCATFPVAPSAPVAAPKRRLELAPVHVAEDRVIRTVVGLRPFRPGGFVVRAEKFGDKTLVHNYGHGGGGMTLSWGTSEQAVRLGFQGADKSYAVLGSGAVGLATARLLQLRGAKVTIHAADLPPDTTSNISGAQWWPYLVYDRSAATPEFMAQFAEAAQLAFRRWQQLVGPGYGVGWRRNFAASDQAPDPQNFNGASGPLKGLAPETDLVFRPGEHPFGNRWLHQFDTMHIEPPIYLHAIMQDIRIAGGEVVVRRFASVEQVKALKADVVFNCTGLGAGALFGDPDILPVKGQLVVLLPQPEVDYNLVADDLYMFPRHDGIMLGGTHERGVWSMEPNAAEVERVMQGQKALFASTPA
jgi:glycine/D-amino acid oxidase-like deaminating enzyme